jgi:diguanylate cyclase (GGDEF)-like protein
MSQTAAERSAPARWSMRHLNTIVGLTAAVGTACVLANIVTALHAAPVALPMMLLTVALVALSDTVVFHLRFGHDNYTVTWSETAVLVGLVFAPAPWIVLAAPLGIVIAQTLARRDALKIAFNAGSTAIGATIASLYVHGIADGTPLTDMSTATRWATLSGAAVMFSTWNNLSVSAVISAARGLPLRAVVREGIALKIAVLVGNTAAAVLVVDIPWHGSVAVLVAFCFLLLFAAYAGYHRAVQESDVWKQLDAATKELTQLDVAAVAAAAVTRAVQLFNIEHAELWLVSESSSTARVYRCVDGERPVVTEQPLHELVASASTAPEGMVVVDAPLDVAVDEERTSIGVLRLRRRAFSKRQHRVLRTFAHGVASSLQNALRYGEMQVQAYQNAYEAARDPLTGIANRKVLVQHLEAGQSGAQLALLVIDLDHFKEINDTLGHHAGDSVLCSVAARLTSAARHDDLVARLGGDEFAVVLPGVDCATAEERARAMLRAISEPVAYTGISLELGASIGIACAPGHGSNAEDLLRRADTAMYQAKQSRGAVASYRSDRDPHSVHRITLAAELRSAISGGQFLLHFQPQVDLTTQQVVGAEALARWNHPTRGLLGPAEFVDLVERSDLVREFALNALDRAAATSKAWEAEGFEVPVSVNLSARNFLDAGLPADVEAVLRRHELAPERLVLELTETTMIRDAEAVEAVLARLRRIGVQISVDDFGTGYSSLAFLQRVAVNEIKIDRSFVIAMTCSENDSVIVRATTELAHGLGIRVVAEGVETQDHVDALTTLGCDVAQGWHFGRPVPASEFLTALRAQHALAQPSRASLARRARGPVLSHHRLVPSREHAAS